MSNYTRMKRRHRAVFVIVMVGVAAAVGLWPAVAWHFDIAAESGRVPVVALYGLVLCDLREGALADALAGMNRLAGEDASPEDAKVLHAILEALAGRVETAVERCEALLTESRRTDLLLDVLVWATEGTHLDLAHRAHDRIDDRDRTRVDVVRAHARLRRREAPIDRARQLCERGAQISARWRAR